MWVKIVKHRCVPFKGHDYTQADGVFELPDAVAKVLIDGGTCAKADSPDRPVAIPRDRPSTPSKDDEKPDSTDDSDNGVEGAVDDVVGDRRGTLLSLMLIPPPTLAVLKKTGYTTVGDILDATVDDLVALRGIGEKTAEMLKNRALAFINEE